MKKIFIILSVILFIFIGCAKGNKDQINYAQYITEKNRHLIGTQTMYSEDNVYLLDNKRYTLESNHVIKSIDDKMQIESEPISEFIVKEENDKYITPEIIAPNASISVFTKKDGTGGWRLNKGEELKINFNKYKSQIVDKQNAIIGYVVNGKMINGEVFSDLSGSYKLTANESGEYYIYIVNASSEYLAFKEGSIIK